MIFTKGTVEKYTFRFQNEDVVEVDKYKVCLDGGYAVFMLDTQHFILSVESDWGAFTYRWCVSERETFKALMLRIGGYYLCDKISSRSEIDWNKTKKNARQDFFRYGKCKNKEKIKEFLNEIDGVDENEIRFYDFVTSYAPDLWEGGFFVKDYPLKAKIIVEIFERYLKGELRKEIEAVDNAGTTTEKKQ